jgi:hypothetical protein
MQTTRLIKIIMVGSPRMNQHSKRYNKQTVVHCEKVASIKNCDHSEIKFFSSFSKCFHIPTSISHSNENVIRMHVESFGTKRYGLKNIC